jgi:hypothetical protein
MSTALSRRGLALLAPLGLLTWSFSWCGAVGAAEVKTSTWANYTSASNPTPDPLSQDLFGTGSPTLSSSIRRDSTKAHAQAWAAATLTGTGVTKSASGTGWLDAGTPTWDAKSETWSSFSFGSPYIVIGPNGTTDFQVRIPAAATLTLAGTGYNLQQQQPNDLMPGLQTIGRTQLPPTTAPAGPPSSFFDIFFELHIHVVQGANDFKVFDGSVNFGANGQVNPSGDSMTPFLNFSADSTGLLTAHFLDDYVFPVLRNNLSVPAITLDNNVPFDLTFQALMRGGDGGSMAADGTFDATGSYPGGLSQVGGGGSFTGIFEMKTPVAGTVLVPEPSGLALAGIAAIGMALCARRRRTR